MRRCALLLLLPALAHGQQVDGGTTLITGARRRPPGATSLRGAEASETPLVEHDALRAVQTFPGVGRAPLGSADLVVWGAAPRETRVEIDGVEVPALYHLGGYRSVLAPSLVGRVELEPAPFRADVGRGLGGVVRVETAGDLPGLHATLSSDLSASSAWLSAGSDTAGLAGAARIGTLAAVVGPLLSGAAADRFALPSSWDAQVKGVWRPTPRDELAVLALASADQLSLRVGADDPSLARGRVESSDFYRLGLTWRRGEPAERVTVTAYAGLDRRTSTLDTPLAQARAVSRTWLGGLKARWRSRLGEVVSASCGFDGLFARAGFSRSGPLTLPAREGDVSAFGEPLSDDRAADAWTVGTLDAALFAGLELSLGPLELEAAVRLSAVAGDVSRLTPRVAATPAVGVATLDFLVEPRLTASWLVAGWLTLHAAAGLSHQAPDGADRSAVFGTPGLRPSHGAHAAAGVSLQPASVLTAEATGFLRAASQLVTRDPNATARLANVLLQQGEGRAWGLNVELRQRAWHGLSSSLAYTLSRSERRDGPGSRWRVSDFDQTHVLTAGVSQQWEGWRVGARLRWATGLPRTPVVGSYLDVRRGVFEPVFGAQSSARLADFLQLDLEASRTFTWGRWWLELFAEVLNVTNRRNVEEWAYDSTFSRREALLGLPLFGTLGLRGGF